MQAKWFPSDHFVHRLGEMGTGYPVLNPREPVRNVILKHIKLFEAQSLFTCLCCKHCTSFTVFLLQYLSPNYICDEVKLL